MPPRCSIITASVHFIKDVKYLNVILDCELDWKNHIEYVIKKATNRPWSRRRLYAKAWGIKPDMAIARALIKCAAIVWCYKSCTRKTVPNFPKYREWGVNS